MTRYHSSLASLVIPALFLQGCANLGDDAFAHSVKSGNSRAAVSAIQPGQARLHIHERDGRWYYPIHYTIVRGDSAATFGLLRNGSPSSLNGRSLAYNAARVNHTGLAHELASAGYGTRSDISQAQADNRRDQQHSREANALAAAGVVALFALLASGSGSSGGSDDVQQRQDEFNQMQMDNNAARSRGESVPHPGF